MNNVPKMKLVFAPGCFDNFEGTQEELDEMIQHIQEAFESGELLEQAEEVDMLSLSDENPDLYDHITEALSSEINDTAPTRRLH